MNNYCTYFDKNYLSRGLCLYDSLVRESKNNFHLFILAFDDTSFNFFKKRKYKNITCVHHSEFEDSTLLRIKTLRTKVEYFWTCTPSIILFFLKKYKLKQCIYLDSDIFFFDDPQNIIREHDNYSVSITSHNYYYLYDQNLTSGKYCVQFMIFNNDKISLNILKWWQAKCNKWCYNRVEKNRFGDQKYLDSWPKRFKKVNVINNLGAGVAPWNVQRFEITKEKKISITENKIKNILNFYHFHDLKFLFNNKIILLSSYKFKKNVYEFIYKPYIKRIIYIEKKNNIFTNKSFLGSDFFIMLLRIIINFKNLKFL